MVISVALPAHGLTSDATNSEGGLSTQELIDLIEDLLLSKENTDSKDNK